MVGLEDGVVGGARQQAEEATLALEKAAQGLRDGEGPVSVRHRSQDLAGEFIGKQGGALSLANAAEISGAAGKGQEMLTPAVRAPDACEASLKPSAGEKLFDTLIRC